MVLHELAESSTTLDQLVQGPGSVPRLPPETDEQIVQQYDEISWGLDARYLLGGLHLQTEFVVNDRAYTARGRPLRSGLKSIATDLEQPVIEKILTHLDKAAGGTARHLPPCRAPPQASLFA